MYVHTGKGQSLKLDIILYVHIIFLRQGLLLSLELTD